MENRTIGAVNMSERRFFIELDKAGSEWVLVAYLSGDPNMLRVIEEGKSPHIVTGALLTGLPEEVVELESKVVGLRNDPIEIESLRLDIPELQNGNGFLPRSMSIRQCAKKANHGLNYMEGWYMFAFLNELPASEAKMIVNGYRYNVYPMIDTWWKSIAAELKEKKRGPNGREETRTLYNLLGHRRQFLGMWGDELWKSAVAYKPQSTNGQMVRRGGKLIYNDMKAAYYGDKKLKSFLDLDLLANVHDSLLLSFPWGKWFSAAECILRCMEHMSPELEAKGRKFKIKTDLKVGGLNWSKMKECKVSRNVNEFGRMIAEAVKASEKPDAKKAA